jgi:2,5-diketo-D-gluconate reductase A
MVSTPPPLVEGPHVIPTIALNDNTGIPQLGFGTYLVDPADAAKVVSDALEAGYRHIDTAQMYRNEAGVGDAIARSGISRGELYVTTKLSNANHERDAVRRSFDRSLTDLQVDYVDLFLMHWPLPTLYDGDFPATWAAMAERLADGRVRSIGVSNFQPAHLDRIIAETGVVPVVNQIEAHPYFANDVARTASLRHGVAIEAWGPLGQGKVLSDPVIGRIADGVGRSPAQVILRWHIERGDIVFPKSTRPERMRQNLDVFDFALTADQTATIDALDRGPDGRVGSHPDTMAWLPA